jgi:PKD repeat protein
VRYQSIKGQITSISLLTRFILGALVFVTVAVLAALTPGSAATPASGIITTSSGPVTYTAGPFVVANESGQGGVITPVCHAAVSATCDQYTLTVNAASVAATKKLMVQIQWPNAAADFDLYILQGATEVASSHGTSNPETVFMNIPSNGTVYTVRVIPTTPLGDSITGTISLADNPPAPQSPPGIAPRYQNYIAPDGMGDDAGEPSIGVDWNPNLASLKHDKVNTGGVNFFQSGPHTLRANFDDCSSPAKDKWDDVTTPLVQQAALSDPIGFVDRQTGRVYSLDLIGGQGNSFMAYSDDDGNNFTPAQGGGAPAGPDHETLGGGPYNPNAVPAPPPHPTYPNAIYYASQNLAGGAEVSRSDDGGLTFGPGVPLFNPVQCVGGIHGHIKVAPDGTVYIPNSSCAVGSGTAGIAVSTDNGITWTDRTVPLSTGDQDPSVGVALTTVGRPAGQTTSTIYLGWIDANNHPFIAVSHDRGLTWANKQDVGTGLGIQNATFPVVVAGDDNRAAYGFLGTTTGGDLQSDSDFKGIWHLYIATTYDGGQSYFVVDATPNDPVQVGSICLGGTTCGGVSLGPSSRNLLDFNDASVDREGRAVIGYADGCLAPSCTTATKDAHVPPYNESRANKAVIARQSGGRRLFAAFDPAEPIAPSAPRVDSVEKDGAGIVHLSWSTPDNGGSPITGYRIYRRTSAGTYGAALATVPDKTTYNDTTANPSASYFYKVTAVNLIGEGTNCGEYPVVNSQTACELPGIQVLSDATGDPLDMLPSHDVQSVSIAEPYLVGANKLFFNIKVASLSTLPPNTAWPVQFKAPNNINYVAEMVTDATNNVTFKYGAGTVATDPTTLTNADALSGYAPSGLITIVVPRSGVGNPSVGQKLTEFLTRINDPLFYEDDAPDNRVPTGQYTIVGNVSCQPNIAPIAVLDATPTSGNAPLAVNFTGANSHDADAGDTIASYSFDFGDGTPVATQSSPTVSHVYQSAGIYTASLAVTDSRGKASVNGEQTTITVNEVAARTNYALSSNGGTALGSTEYPGGGYPAAGAINGDRTGGNWGNGPGGWSDGTRDAYDDSLEISFNGSKSIDEIRLYTLQDAFRNAVEPTPDMTCTYYGLIDFDVQYWDGSNWVTVPGGSVTGNDKVMRVFTFTAISTGKIRVVSHNARAHYSRVVEVEAFGAGGQ